MIRRLNIHTVANGPQIGPGSVVAAQSSDGASLVEDVSWWAGVDGNSPQASPRYARAGTERWTGIQTRRRVYTTSPLPPQHHPQHFNDISFS